MPLDASLPVTVGHWTCQWAQGGLKAEYDQIPILRGGNVQLFTTGGRGLYGANAHPPACRVEPLDDGGRAYVTRFHYADTSDSATFDAEQRIEVHASQQITFDIRAHWNGPQPVRLEWNPLRLWAYALVNAQYTSQTQINAVVTPAPTKKPNQDGQRQNNAPPVQQSAQQFDSGSANAPIYQDNGTGHIGWQPRTGPLAVTQLSTGWQRLAFRHTGIGDITLTADPLAEQSAAQNGEQARTNQNTALTSVSATGAADKNAPDDLPIVYDGRGDVNLRGDRIFWGGYVGATLTPGREFARRITLTVTPSPPLTPAAPSLPTLLSAAPSLAAPFPSSSPASGKQAIPQHTPLILPVRLRQQTFTLTAPMQDSQGHPLIVPTPKSAKFNASDYVVGGTLTICTQPDPEPNGPQRGIRLMPVTPLKPAGPRVLAELRRLGEELSAQARTNVRFTTSPRKCDLHVYIAPLPPRDPAAPASTSSTMSTMSTMEEGYRLRVSEGGITLIARDDAGAFYGLQTLRQLLT